MVASRLAKLQAMREVAKELGVWQRPLQVEPRTALAEFAQLR